MGEFALRRFTGTGFGGNGLTFATLAAMMAAEAVEHRATPWANLFGIDRPRGSAAA